mmetsp:Transcript_30370/g.46989  ORF Transcript_30370/g.46989 Transcript_30370/m.46989 type:complete len:364 (-) Transcript_30370:215-1306(-)
MDTARLQHPSPFPVVALACMSARQLSNTNWTDSINCEVGGFEAGSPASPPGASALWENRLVRSSVLISRFFSSWMHTWRRSRQVARYMVIPAGSHRPPRPLQMLSLLLFLDAPEGSRTRSSDISAPACRARCRDRAIILLIAFAWLQIVVVLWLPRGSERGISSTTARLRHTSSDFMAPCSRVSTMAPVCTSSEMPRSVALCGRASSMDAPSSPSPSPSTDRTSAIVSFPCPRVNSEIHPRLHRYRIIPRELTQRSVATTTSPISSPPTCAHESISVPSRMMAPSWHTMRSRYSRGWYRDRAPRRSASSPSACSAVSARHASSCAERCSPLSRRTRSWKGAPEISGFQRSLPNPGCPTISWRW